MREEGEVGGSGLQIEETMLWSLQGSYAEVSSFPLQNGVLALVIPDENLDRRELHERSSVSSDFLHFLSAAINSLWLLTAKQQGEKVLKIKGREGLWMK